MTALQLSQAAVSDNNFRSRVQYYMIKAAIAITTESSGTANHASRLALANKIIIASPSYLTSFALAVLTNPTLAATDTAADIVDGDLEFSLNSIYDSLLGI